MNRFLAGAAVLTLTACGKSQALDPTQQVGPNPVLPEPKEAIISAVDVPKVVGWKTGEMPSVPAGFRIQPFATGFQHPRNVYTLANGDVLVVESDRVGTEPVDRPKDPIRDFIMSMAHGGSGGDKPKQPQRVTLLRDADGDGTAESRTILIDNLNSPFGIAQSEDSLYIANTGSILRYPFEPGQTKVGGPPQKVVDLPEGLINHHWTKSLAVSPDGSKLYAGVGSNSNVQERGPEAETGRAAIWEVDASTGAYRVFASGLRNPNGLTFYPGSNTLWAVINERDEIGASLVPDYMTSVRPGAFYGWPYSYYGQHVDRRVRPQRPDLIAKAIAPDYALSSHVAPLGLTFYTGASFPPMFRGGAFIGEHGSWNRTQPNGYRIAFVRFANGKPVGKPMAFVTGFLDPEGNARGRPVGVAIDRTGALLIADDAGNTIWRVSHVGARAERSVTQSGA